MAYDFDPRKYFVGPGDGRSELVDILDELKRQAELAAAASKRVFLTFAQLHGFTPAPEESFENFMLRFREWLESPVHGTLVAPSESD